MNLRSINPHLTSIPGYQQISAPQIPQTGRSGTSDRDSCRQLANSHGSQLFCLPGDERTCNPVQDCLRACKHLSPVTGTPLPAQSLLWLMPVVRTMLHRTGPVRYLRRVQPRDRDPAVHGDGSQQPGLSARSPDQGQGATTGCSHV